MIDKSQILNVKPEPQPISDMKLIVPTSSPANGNTIVSRSQFKPMPFSTDMVKAILSGKKTQNRRIVKQAKGWDINWKVIPIKEGHLDGIQRYEIRCGTQYHLPWFKSKFSVSDILWVRETWACISYRNPDETEYEYFYRASNRSIYEDGEKIKWKPSLFMPKDACRLFLDVKELRTERLQNISEQDAIAEGVINLEGTILWYNYIQDRYTCWSAIESYKSLWQKINGVDSWEENPIVWVATFAIVECPQGFC